jgi:hypothetical protein
MIAAGALMVTLCGSCTTYVVFSPSWGGSGGFLGQIVILAALVVGGVPTLIGALILGFGLRRWRP